MDQQEKARTLRAAHETGVLVLPNAWDVGSAVLIQRAGAKAIATTSAGVSWGLGYGDGQQLSRDQMIDVVAKIVDAVEVPVTADVEGGYGLGPEAVAETVTQIIGAGAVGINLEDSKSTDWTLFTSEEQGGRIAAARAAAAEAGLAGLFVNARTDVFLFGIGEEGGRVDDVLARASAYAAAGADGLFVPGLTDLDTLRTITRRSPIPVNAMVGPGAPTVAELAEAGVRRISLGGMIAQAAYAMTARAAEEVLTGGTYDTLAAAGSFADVNGAFKR